MWDIIKKQNYKLYKNKNIDLKIKVYEYEKTDKVYINYKGYNLTVPMVVWEFEAECLAWSIKNVKMEGDTPFNKHFVVGKKDYDVFLDLIYFFLVENDSDAMIQERYKAEWDE